MKGDVTEKSRYHSAQVGKKDRRSSEKSKKSRAVRAV